MDATQVRQYLEKAEEFLLAAQNELDAGLNIAATSLAVHAGINAADAVTGKRLGVRAAGESHDEVFALLADVGKDGQDLGNQLRRLLMLKTKAQYEPDDIPTSQAMKAVERAERTCIVSYLPATTTLRRNELAHF